MVEHLGLERFNLSNLTRNVWRPLNWHPSICDLLCRNLSVFTSGDNNLGRTHLTLHQIDIGGTRPVKMPSHRVPLHLQHEISEHLKQMLENYIVQPCHTRWAAAVVLVCKDRSLWFCVDYHKLNDRTRKVVSPLPRIHDALDSLSKFVGSPLLI